MWYTVDDHNFYNAKCKEFYGKKVTPIHGTFHCIYKSQLSYLVKLIHEKRQEKVENAK